MTDANRRVTVGEARRSWRAGFHTAESLAAHLGWPYPAELLDGLLRSAYRNGFPDETSLIAAAMDAQRLAWRDLKLARGRPRSAEPFPLHKPAIEPGRLRAHLRDLGDDLVPVVAVDGHGRRPPSGRERVLEASRGRDEPLAARRRPARRNREAPTPG
jgi:hypothetical protein